VFIAFPPRFESRCATARVYRGFACFVLARPDRTFADAAAAFFARAMRCAFVMFFAAVFPPIAPVFLKNSNISVSDPNLSTPAD
jgi:hypothetical protein